MPFAMLQAWFVRFFAAFQMILMVLFVAPKNPAPIDYGGVPQTKPEITETLQLFDDGATDYALVYPDGAEPSVMTGVNWLESFLEEMTGGDIAKLALSAASAQEKAVYVGIAPPATDVSGIQNDGFLKIVLGEDVYLYGAGRGTMYACADFLEQELGCRWYTPERKIIPKNADAAIDANLNSLQNAALEYRDVYWGVVDKFPEWKAFHKQNSSFQSYMGAEYGYGVQFIDFCHSMERLVPAAHYAEHPEYFSYRLDQKAWTLDQRCLTNPAVLQMAIEKVVRDCQNALDGYIYSVSQNDNNRPCQCANCLAMDAKYGGPSGTNIWFVNQVADAVKAAYPDKAIIIETLAYDYTVAPPTGIVPRDNMVIRLCSIGCCRAHPIDECGHTSADSIFEQFKENNDSSFKKDIAGWSAICDRLYVWDYTTNFKDFTIPFPNLHMLSHNMNFFLDNNVIGLFEQGNHSRRNGEFAELRAYILTKLMWDRTVAVEPLMMEFMNAYYGEAAAPFIKEYIDLITRKAMDTSHFYIFGRPENTTTFFPSEYKKFDALWDKAEQAAAGDDYQLENVCRSRLSLRIHKANLMLDEFSILNSGREEATKKLFHDVIMSGITHFKEGEALSEPTYLNVWKVRPFEWAAPASWIEGVKKEDLTPMDFDGYIAAHSGEQWFKK